MTRSEPFLVSYGPDIIIIWASKREFEKKNNQKQEKIDNNPKAYFNQKLQPDKTKPWLKHSSFEAIKNIVSN